jgi:putative endopeptidase
MIKHIVLCGAATLALAAAAPSWAANQAATPAAAQAGKPELGTWGFDAAGMDRSVKPGDNFFDFVNGTWTRTTEIPADRSSWGAFNLLADLSDQRIRSIIEESARANAPAGTNARKVGDFFASYMDEAAIEAKGVSPIQDSLRAIAAIRNTSELSRTFGELGQFGVAAPFGSQIEQDLKDNSRYAAYVGQGGLGLPDRDYYLDDSNPKFVEARGKYKAHIATMLRLAGIADPEAKAQRIFDLETKIARSHWTRVESRQIDKLYNPKSRPSSLPRYPASIGPPI